MPMSDFLGISAYFLIMSGLAGLGTYLLVRRDFSGRYTALLTISCAISVGATSWLGFVFSFSPSSVPRRSTWCCAASSGSVRRFLSRRSSSPVDSYFP